MPRTRTSESRTVRRIGRVYGRPSAQSVVVTSREYNFPMHARPVILLLVAVLLPTSVAARDVATFSIVARDPQTGELGVAVASRFFSVGSVVPWAQAGAGAIATQANANVTFGPRGLELLARKATAEETLKILLRGDSGAGAGGRQVGIVAADGSSATYTGPDC